MTEHLDPIRIPAFTSEMRAAFSRARKRRAGYGKFARDSGISKTSIRQWEGRENRPRGDGLPNLKSLARVLHIYTAWSRRHSGVKPAEDTLVRHWRKCGPETRRFLSMLAELGAGD